jgi:hypothetical protein
MTPGQLGIHEIFSHESYSLVSEFLGIYTIGYTKKLHIFFLGMKSQGPWISIHQLMRWDRMFSMAQLSLGCENIPLGR